MTNDFTRAAQNVASLPDNIEDGVNRQMRVAVHALMASAKAALAKPDKRGDRSVVTGNLFRSIEQRGGRAGQFSEPSFTDTALDSYGKHIVRADAPYAAYVEYGTGLRGLTQSPMSGANFDSPDVAPYDAIREWIDTKGITPRQFDSRDALASAIADSIKAFGTRPHPYMRPAWSAHESDLKRAHRNGVRQGIRRSF
jgi:hypothetical protein